MLAATVANSSGNYKRTLQIKDFMPEPQSFKKKKLDPAALMLGLKSLTVALGGKIVKGK